MHITIIQGVDNMSFDIEKSKKLAITAYEALEDKKGENIQILEVAEVSVIADYFIIANGNNPSQITALVDSVDEAMHKAGAKSPRIEGHQNSSWVLMDYGDVIIHVFSKEDREFYNLERLWADCTRVEI